MSGIWELRTLADLATCVVSSRFELIMSLACHLPSRPNPQRQCWSCPGWKNERHPVTVSGGRQQEEGIQEGERTVFGGGGNVASCT